MWQPVEKVLRMRNQVIGTGVEPPGTRATSGTAERRLAALLLLTCCLASRLSAHQDVHEKLEQLNALLREDPDNAEILLRRGELHRIHRDWKAAETDYSRVRELAPALALVDLCGGRMLLEAERPQEALRLLERFLTVQPDHLGARIFRARALRGVGRVEDAVVEYTRAIREARQPLPQHYIERANVLTGAGDLAAAVRGLDEGLERLGPLITLELRAIDLERRQGAHDAALRRVDRLVDTAPNKPRWLAERGAILVAAGRWQEGVEAYRSTLASIDSLSARRRKLRLFQGLREQVEGSIERVVSQQAMIARRRVIMASVVGSAVLLCGILAAIKLLRSGRAAASPRSDATDSIA